MDSRGDPTGVTDLDESKLEIKSDSAACLPTTDRSESEPETTAPKGVEGYIEADVR